MHIAVRAIQARRHFQLAHIVRRLEITGLVGLNIGVAGLPQQNRQPADFQFRAGTHHHIRGARAGDKTGTSLDAMRILQSIGGGINRDFIATQFLR